MICIWYVYDIMYMIWSWSVWHVLINFCLFTPHPHPHPLKTKTKTTEFWKKCKKKMVGIKILKKEKRKKKRLDISSFYICVLKIMIIIMLYCSWDMTHGECNFILFFHFVLFFCPFTPILARKIKVLKYEKKTPGDIILHFVPKIMVKWCAVPET